MFYLDGFLGGLGIGVTVDVFLLSAVLLQGHGDLLWLWWWDFFGFFGCLAAGLLLIFILNLFCLSGQFILSRAPVTGARTLLLVDALKFHVY